MSVTLRVTLLGTGSSGGVPRVDGDWGACDPSEPKNRRTRCSLLVERFEGAHDPDRATVVLIDTSPDLRAQLLSAGVKRCDGVLYTHDHADQTHGIDDLRVLCYRMRRRIPAWLDAPTRASLFARFGYIFETPPGSHYPAILDAREMPAPGGQVVIEGPGGPIAFTPLAQEHGEIGSLGFRFGPVAYCNDANSLPEETLRACEGAELFIVDALRPAPHPSHAHLDLSLDWIARVKATRAVLTNMHIDMDYATLVATLPVGVEPGYDGWMVEFAAA